jgi:DNA-directed RNA polymerase specialized sigma subunit
VAVIKGMLEKGVKQNLVAKMFCVSEMQVSRIARKENWAEIEPKM